MVTEQRFGVLFARPVGVGVTLNAGTNVWVVSRPDNGFR